MRTMNVTKIIMTIILLTAGRKNGLAAKYGFAVFNDIKARRPDISLWILRCRELVKRHPDEQSNPTVQSAIS
jgi:hypothetical protein